MFELLHPTSNTAGTRAEISIGMKKSRIFATELFSFWRHLFAACEMIDPFYHSGL
jgi:hypothetical protein